MCLSHGPLSRLFSKGSASPASCLEQAMHSWSVETQHLPSQHCSNGEAKPQPYTTPDTRARHNRRRRRDKQSLIQKTKQCWLGMKPCLPRSPGGRRVGVSNPYLTFTPLPRPPAVPLETATLDDRVGTVAAGSAGWQTGDASARSACGRCGCIAPTLYIACMCMYPWGHGIDADS